MKNEQVVIVPGKKIQAEEPERDVAVSQAKPRSQPIQGYSVEAVKIMLKDKGFFDKNWNRDAPGFSHQYEVQKDGKAVYDHSSGLMWQQSGPTGEMPYEKAKAYINALNSQAFAGYHDWRLPTLEEAMTLMETARLHEGLYINPHFDKQQLWIWTSDTYSASNAWVAYFRFGLCNYGDFKHDYSVRAVR